MEYVVSCFTFLFIQFEGILLEVCEKQYEISDNLDSKVDIEVRPCHLV